LRFPASRHGDDLWARLRFFERESYETRYAGVAAGLEPAMRPSTPAYCISRTVVLTDYGDMQTIGYTSDICHP
jgi:hypothetical protein